MKINTLKYISLLFLAMLSSKAIAQQDPSFSLYQFNMNIINPAYVGSSETTEATAMIRSQWTGIENAPSTQTLSFSSPTVLGKNMGLGFSIVNDKFNIAKETAVSLDFSYKLPLSENQSLFLGLKAGGSFFNVELASLQINDPLFSKNISSFNPNFGVGAYLKGKNYYASLSVPTLLKSSRYQKDGNTITEASDKPHIYLSSGYIFDLDGVYNTKLTPSFMMRYVSGVPVSFDVTVITSMLEKYEIGVSHRLQESVSFFGLFKFLDHYKIGYAYEYTTTDISIYSSGSHEFVFKYRF
ncbi:PorP/SprF family type IX secretion system membrane protein [Tenacibaculum dicentrarchi]|uniref:PorP/SprF family type IX secretion system membrane protein n=1 Tax=Tenacibaculum dicentrarchi TaxID=669041 RepID=UPI000C7DD790|nr:conserved exported hypothetical protein [Tenacibaculum dicentrarchi]